MANDAYSKAHEDKAILERLTSPTEPPYLEAIARRHRNLPPFTAFCDGCGSRWPCETQRLLAEVRRLREERDQREQPELPTPEQAIPAARANPCACEIYETCPRCREPGQ